MTKTIFVTTGTCATEIHVEIEGAVIAEVTFVGGCQGNSQGVSALVKGMPVTDVICKVKGIQCRNSTSCPDQLALALESLTLKNAS